MLDFSSLRGKKINWFWLALSFALAVLLWGYVTVQDNPVIEQRYDAQIEYVNLPDDLAVLDKPETVRVKVSATANVLAGLNASDIIVKADLQNAVLGQYAARLQFDMPGGVQLVSSDITEAVVFIDNKKEKQFAVHTAYTDAEPLEGYMALEASILPGEVVISGAEDKLAQVEDVYVTVDLDSLQQNFRAGLPVNIVDANGNSLLSWLTPQPAMVDVLVPVVGSQPTKVAPISVTLSGAPAEGYVISRIIIDPAVTTVYGPQSLLSGVDYVYTSAVNISGAASSVSQSVTLLNIDGVTVDKSAVYQVQVVIERESVRTIDDVALTMVNQQSAYNYQLASPTCSVTVSGPASVVNTLTNTDIEARVDVGALGVGSHRQQIRAYSSGNVGVVVDDLATVTVDNRN